MTINFVLYNTYLRRFKIKIFDLFIIIFLRRVRDNNNMRNALKRCFRFGFRACTPQYVIACIYNIIIIRVYDVYLT